MTPATRRSSNSRRDLSRRNFIAIALRAPQELPTRADGHVGYTWGADGEHAAFIEEYLIRAVEQTRRNYHVHSERIYLLGMNEGATPAYRLGLSMPNQIAGVIALNGVMPRPTPGVPLFRFPDVKQLRSFIGYGHDDPRLTMEEVRRDFRVLYSAGVDVRFHIYTSGEATANQMLRDVNRWIMDDLNQDIDQMMLADEIDDKYDDGYGTFDSDVIDSDE